MVNLTEQCPDPVAWDPNLDVSHYLNGDAGALLENYSHVAPSEQEAHVKLIAETAWRVINYPCFRMLWFLRFEVAQYPIYGEIVQRVKDGGLFLDLGCGLAQDVRRLVYDGAPSENTIALDNRAEFINLGYALFQDKETLKTEFVVQNFLDDSLFEHPWAGKISVANAGYFIHIWSWNGQVKAIKRILRLLSMKDGDTVTGLNFGKHNPGPAEGFLAVDGEPVFRHNPTTISRLWEQVGEETGTKWVVEARMEEDEGHRNVMSDGDRLVWYAKLQK
ncbi:hypothetical protein ASPWEDRAFT_168013 [Aspergillus wentii DTO 134E9]|uniref:Methyltransferase domain-containing protein n=1 Tax=Aspergillus wentii DTO 134E9 TaxID=1073089 RepID=A0A1L9RT30_ASPWE|nr:uncharacterized protein ASPWEDRAFT_168013 [Aspergillus wentii DTO 134E9]KAI9933739.1 hypothetical protein MW887_004811 [Aspergillus wentii]OJJ38080.1 hypothetical protein ASPWEDRAFT_168013 [Aspergillus wentii DTO 134E9]